MRATRDLIVLIPALLAAGVLGALLIQPGCSASQCKQPTGATGPTPSFECPADNVCYQGQCRRSCNASRELDPKMMCNSDSDCKDSNLPHCAANGPPGQNLLFCSSCGNGETCVPELNICQAVSDQSLDATMPSGISATDLPPLPLDAGPIDGAHITPDAQEPTGPPTQALTHVAAIEVLQLTDFRNDPNANETSVVSVSYFDVRSAGTSTPAKTIASEGNCTLTQLRTFAAPQNALAVNGGDVSVSTGLSLKPAINVPDGGAVVAKFGAGGYTVLPTPLPNPLLNFSVPGADGGIAAVENYLAFAGLGASGVDGPWIGSNQVHVPYRFQPSTGTLMFLKSGVTTATVPQDLTFGWNIEIPATDLQPEDVFAEIQGQQASLKCAVDEGSMSSLVLVMHSGLISQFITADGVQRNKTPPDCRTLILARGSDLEVIPPGVGYTDVDASKADAKTTVVDVTFRVAHIFYTSICF
jgi:hypothetical protein